MSFIQAVRGGLRDWLIFRGRSRRSAFWWWTVFQLGLMLLASLVDEGLRSQAVELIVSLLLLMPTLAYQVRRLHDTNRSGWWVLLGIVPVVGLIPLVVWWCFDSDRGANKYGDDPKRGIDAAVFDEPRAT